MSHNVNASSGARPSSGARDARARKSGEALRAAMLTLLEQKPLEQITVRDIASEAGVAYATFFRHHPTKEALLDHVAAGQIEELVGLTLPILDRGDSRASVSALFGHIDAHRALWSALLTGGAAGTMRAELLRVSRAVALERAPGHRTMPLELGVNYSVSLIVETLVWWLAQPAGTVDPDALAETLHHLLAAVEQAGSKAATFQ